MTYQVLMLPEAEQDLEEAYNWYEEQNTGLGSEFIRVVDASFSTIQRNPFASAVVYQQVRRKLIRKFPDSLFCIVKNEVIVINKQAYWTQTTFASQLRYSVFHCSNLLAGYLDRIANSIFMFYT